MQISDKYLIMLYAKQVNTRRAVVIFITIKISPTFSTKITFVCEREHISVPPPMK